MSSLARQHRASASLVTQRLSTSDASPIVRYAVAEILAMMESLNKRLERFENAELETEG